MIYFLFGLIVLIALIFDNWLDKEDLTRSLLISFVVMSLFPILNVLCLVIAVFRIIAKSTPTVLLKGRK